MVELVVHMLAVSVVALTLIIVLDGLVRAVKSFMGRDQWTQ